MASSTGVVTACRTVEEVESAGGAAGFADAAPVPGGPAVPSLGAGGATDGAATGTGPEGDAGGISSCVGRRSCRLTTSRMHAAAAASGAQRNASRRHGRGPQGTRSIARASTSGPTVPSAVDGRWARNATCSRQAEQPARCDSMRSASRGERPCSTYAASCASSGQRRPRRSSARSSTRSRRLSPFSSTVVCPEVPSPVPLPGLHGRE